MYKKFAEKTMNEVHFPLCCVGLEQTRELLGREGELEKIYMLLVKHHK